MVRKAKPPLLTSGDVIKTHPTEGFWGCSVVLNTRGRTEYFNPMCLIGITPVIFRQDFTWQEIANYPLKVLEFDRDINLMPNIVATRRETCIGCYDSRLHPDLSVIGSVDVHQVFQGSLDFEPVGDGTQGRWPLCGRITTGLGMEAVTAWRRENDREQWLLELGANRRDHWELMARLKQEEREKRLLREQRKA